MAANRVELAFLRAIRPLVPHGTVVLAAVSGGSDSVALLHLLARWRRDEGDRLVIGHLDHGLRPGSPADRRFVERMARELGVPVLSDRRPVARLRRRDESLEEAARRVRRAFLLETAATSGATRIATGHTLDDQAETVLLRFARGAGPGALAGMAAHGPGPFVRPLLGIERSHLRVWLGRRRIPFRDDPSNADDRFDRNRVRRLVVPVLADALNPSAARHLVEAAERLRDDADLLDAMAREAVDRGAARRAGAWRIAASSITDVPLPIARRMARLLLQRAGVDPRRIGSRHILALVDLAHGAHGRALNLPDRRLATRTRDRIRIR